MDLFDLISHVPKGVLYDCLSIYEPMEDSLPLPSKARVFLISLHHVSKAFSSHEENFSFQALESEVQELGLSLGVKKFKNNVEFLKLIQPFYEVLHQRRLADSEIIEEYSEISVKDVVNVVDDFVNFGFNFRNWKKSQKKIIKYCRLKDRSAVYYSRKYIQKRLHITGGTADEHRVEVKDAIKIADNYIKAYQLISESSKHKNPPEVYSDASFSHPASFEFRFSADADSEELFVEESRIVKRIVGKFVGEGDAKDLIKKYGKPVFKKYRELLEVISENGYNISVESEDEKIWEISETIEFQSGETNTKFIEDYEMPKPEEIDEEFTIEGELIRCLGDMNTLVFNNLRSVDREALRQPNLKKVSIKVKEEFFIKNQVSLKKRHSINFVGKSVDNVLDPNSYTLVDYYQIEDLFDMMPPKE